MKRLPAKGAIVQIVFSSIFSFESFFKKQYHKSGGKINENFHNSQHDSKKADAVPEEERRLPL